MMSFNQFMEFERQFKATALAPRVQYAPTTTASYGSAQGYYNQALDGIAGERVRELHVNPDNGRMWDIQYAFAKPLAPRSLPFDISKLR